MVANNIIIVKLYGGDCNLYSKNNTTLNYAVRHENTNIVKIILSKLDKNNVNDVNSKGESAHHIAVNNGRQHKCCQSYFK